MTARDRLLAIVVAVCWGLNFPATALALRQFPPLFMVSLRFLLIAVPTLLLVPRPQVRLRWLIGTGAGIGVVQFSCLYLGMAIGMPSGLASLVLQASAPFTVILAGVFLRERLSARQVVGVLIAVGGLAAIAVHRSQVAALLPLVLTLCGALGWAIGTVCSRQAKAPNPFHLTLWMSTVPVLPLLGLSLLVEGPGRIAASVSTAFTMAALPSILGLLYIVLIATLIGYSIWNILLTRYPSSTVAPFSMLVPIVGVLSSWLIFGEGISVVEAIAGCAVVGGVLFGSRAARPGRSAAVSEPPQPVPAPAR